jgi:GAF domain-containing protein
MPEPLPLPTERQRLLRMGALRLGEIEAIPSLDPLVEELAKVMRIEMTAVALVLEREQVFVARHGMDFRRGARDTGICTHALVRPDEALIIPDALYDPRVMDSPLVLAAPRIRSYAGRPLCLEPGLAIGTLCAFGPVPRHFSAEERLGLERIAGAVLEEIRAVLAKARLH